MDDAPWLDDVEMAAWRALIGAFSNLTAVLDAELQSAHGLSLAEYEVLVHLSEAPDRRLRMSELAERVHLSPSGLTRRLDGLVTEGLVARYPCPADRRGSFAVLTDEGMRRLEEAAPTHVLGVRHHLVDRLTRGQLVDLASALGVVGAAPAPRPAGAGK